MAGRPSKVGGTVAKVVGWITMAIGLSIALVIGAFFQWIWAAGVAGYVVGGGIGLVTMVVSMLLLKGGKSLQKSGEGEARFTRVKAIFALATHRGGVVTALDAASALGVSSDEADALLTDLAKTLPEQVSLELDDQGGIYYRFPAMLGWNPPSAGGPPAASSGAGPVRVDAAVAEPSRVAPTPARGEEVELLDAEVEPPQRASRPIR